MTGCPAITQHALERYMKRAKLKNVQIALERLSDLAVNAKPIGRKQRYYNGWIIVMRRGEIKTAFRPRTLNQMEAVYKLFKKSNEAQKTMD